MRCPYCLKQDTKVVDKRDVEGLVRRRRECLKCKKRFSTHEKLERAGLRVVKKSGQREPFDYEKLKRGVLAACEKRPIESERVEKMLNNIEDRMRKKGKEVESTLIGDVVMRELKKLDQVAYIRFASVYKDFTEIGDFRKEIRLVEK